MSINTQTMYEQFVQAEGVSDSGRMRMAYLRALNRALSELRDECWVADADAQDDLDVLDLDSKYEPVLEDGVKYFIQRSGEWTKDPDVQARSYWQESKGKARRYYIEENEIWDGEHAGSASG
jgi:hypothetical protein